MTVSNGGRSDSRFYRPAMAPSFIDSKRSTKLGFNLGNDLGSADPGEISSKHQSFNSPIPSQSSDWCMDHLPSNPLFTRQHQRRLVLSPPPHPVFSPRVDSLPALRLSEDVWDEPTAAREIRWNGVGLPVYDGAWDADILEEWISKMESFFELCRGSMSEEDKMACAVFHLRGTAHKWWRNRQSKNLFSEADPINGESPDAGVRSWTDLKRELIRFFMPRLKSQKAQVLRRMKSLRQTAGMSLREYDEQYLELSLEADQLVSEWELVESYVGGLRDERLRRFVVHAFGHCRVETLILQHAMRLASYYEDDPITSCRWCHEQLL